MAYVLQNIEIQFYSSSWPFKDFEKEYTNLNNPSQKAPIGRRIYNESFPECTMKNSNDAPNETFGNQLFISNEFSQLVSIFISGESSFPFKCKLEATPALTEPIE